MSKAADQSITPQGALAVAELRKVSSRLETPNKSCILVVTSQSRPTEPMIEYVINVADRLGSKILVACVNTRPHLQATLRLSRSFVTSPQKITENFRKKAESKGIEFECIGEAGKISKVISRLCHIVKRVEFVIIDQGIRMEEAATGSPVPVFSVVSNELASAQAGRGRQTQTFFHGENRMKATSRKSYFTKTLVFGALTAALYGVVFAYQEAIMQYWTKGGMYTLLPVATVFVFSYVHGSFTGNFWSALGIEGSKASTPQPKAPQATTSDKAAKRPDNRPRVQVST
jgi:hypothetical protein